MKVDQHLAFILFYLAIVLVIGEKFTENINERRDFKARTLIEDSHYRSQDVMKQREIQFICDYENLNFENVRDHFYKRVRAGNYICVFYYRRSESTNLVIGYLKPELNRETWN